MHGLAARQSERVLGCLDQGAPGPLVNDEFTNHLAETVEMASVPVPTPDVIIASGLGVEHHTVRWIKVNF